MKFSPHRPSLAMSSISDSKLVDDLVELLGKSGPDWMSTLAEMDWVSADQGAKVRARMIRREMDAMSRLRSVKVSAPVAPRHVIPEASRIRRPRTPEVVEIPSGDENEESEEDEAEEDVRGREHLAAEIEQKLSEGMESESEVEVTPTKDKGKGKAVVMPEVVMVKRSPRNRKTGYKSTEVVDTTDDVPLVPDPELSLPKKSKPPVPSLHAKFLTRNGRRMYLGIQVIPGSGLPLPTGWEDCGYFPIVCSSVSDLFCFVHR